MAMRSPAFSRSALRPRTTGLLPPSSSVTGTRFSAAACMTRRPVAVEPVKSKWSNGSEENSLATSGPPVTTATSASSNVLATSSRVSSLVASVNSLGLIIARLPAANTWASGPSERFTGKFHGLKMPTTPFGSKRSSAFAPNRPRGNCVLRRSGCAQPAMFFKQYLAKFTVPTMSVSMDCSRLRLPKS